MRPGLRTEIDIGREALRFVKKDPSKLKMVSALYALSLHGIEKGRVVRSAYFLMRYLDDLLDGEMGEVEDGPAVADNVKTQLETRNFDMSTSFGRMAAYAVPRLEAAAGPKDDPVNEFNRLIEAMLFDNARQKELKTLSADELELYYREIIEPGLNITLLTVGSNLR